MQSKGKETMMLKTTLLSQRFITTEYNNELNMYYYIIKKEQPDGSAIYGVEIKSEINNELDCAAHCLNTADYQHACRFISWLCEHTVCPISLGYIIEDHYDDFCAKHKKILSF